MDDYKVLLQNSLDLKRKREDRFREISKDRLYKIAKKKIQTTMIGALSSIEEHFSFLWEAKPGEDLTPEQTQLKGIFDEARSEILDRGNTQIRNLETELSNYEVSWKRQTVQLPVTKEGEHNE